MALPSSGAISFKDINTEILVSPTAQVSLNDTLVRTVFGQASGAIDMNTGRGKSYRPAVSYIFASNTTNASLNVASISGYIAGLSDVVVTINSGIYVYSTSTGTPALSLSGGTAGDTVKIVNNGYIAGMGGTVIVNQASGSGGPALSLGFNTTIDNTNASAYIGGGGGGGSGATYGGGGAGGGGTMQSGFTVLAGGGPGEPGQTGATVSGAAGTVTGGGGGGAGGGGGGYISSGSGKSLSTSSGYGGSGGRIFPGAGGAGGGGGTGGAGGSGNSVGGTAYTGGACGGGGGWGAAGGFASESWPAGAGGYAVYLNGHTVTWVGGDTTRIYGAIG